MTPEEIIDALKSAVPDLQVEVVPAFDQPTLVVPREQIVAVCTALRDTPSLRFNCLDLTAVDWWPGEPRFQVVYHLASFESPQRLRLKVPVPGEEAHVATISTLWPAANWLEREVYDLFGIIFDGHPDLRRVLMPEDWEGYPLRKDYPVQIKLPVKIYEALELTPEEFRKRIEDDRVVRGHAVVKEQ
jgi:NADH-quinone oxidoreductase subunit C